MELVQNRVFIIADKAFQRRWVPILFRLMAITLGGLHAWAAVISYSMNADGISYLDIGDAYMRGDWNTAISSVWSPLYSWMLGLVMYLLSPSMRWEFPLVHLVNFVIYLAALSCFEFFWRQLWHYQEYKRVFTSSERYVSLPEWAWFALGYILFIWSSLHLIEIWAVTPDMLMAAFVYLAAGLIVRLRIGFITWRTFILLGITLGLGYLTKAVMLPLAFIFLGIALFSVENKRQGGPRILVALMVFLLFSAPFIGAISKSKGKLTFGEAGTLTYVRHVNGLPYPHWQGEGPDNGAPKHPSRKIFESPAIYEFSAPIAGTYPISYDPSYWYEGVVAQFDLEQQLSRLISSSLFYFDLFFRQQGVLIVSVIVLYLMSHWRRFSWVDLVPRWGLIIPALVAFGMYAPAWVEGRYIGMFVVLFWADLLANICLPASQTFHRLVLILSVIMILFMLMNIMAFNLEGFHDLNEDGNQPVKTQARPPSWPGEVAEALHGLGLQPGDKVAVIGYGFDSFWARLARVQIVAEMLEEEADPFWLGDPSLQSQVIQVFATTGAKAIVAENVPSYASLTGWRQVGNSNYYIYRLSERQ